MILVIKESAGIADVFSNLFDWEDGWDILFIAAELCRNKFVGLKDILRVVTLL